MAHPEGGHNKINPETQKMEEYHLQRYKQLNGDLVLGGLGSWLLSAGLFIGGFLLAPAAATAAIALEIAGSVETGLSSLAITTGIVGEFVRWRQSRQLKKAVAA